MTITAQTAIQQVTDTLFAPVRYTGAGSPEGSVTSDPGWLYRDTTTNLLWCKASGSGNTGWVTSAQRNIVTCAVPTLLGFANATTAAHTLGYRPDSINATLQCISADLNYSVGDEIEWTAMGISAPPLVWMPTTANMTVNRVQTYIYLPDKTTGTPAVITDAKWTCKFRLAMFPIT